MTELKIEHILLFLIAIFLLYHLMIYGVNHDRFYVGDNKQLFYLDTGTPILNNVCQIHNNTTGNICMRNFYKNGNTGILQQCHTEHLPGAGIECHVRDSADVCNGTNCPSCDSFIMKNMNLEFNASAAIVKQPLDCTSIVSKDVNKCESTYSTLYEKNASNIVWDNGSFTEGDSEKLYNKGTYHWNHPYNKITDICDSPMQASILRQNIKDRCNDNIESSVNAVIDIDRNIDTKDKDVDIIKQVKNIITDETKEYGKECCGPSKKCSPSELSKLQDNYLEKIAKEIYCKPTTCNTNEICNGSYFPNTNNGSGSLGTNCNMCKSGTLRLQDNTCGKVTCGLYKQGMCKKGETCEPQPAIGHLPPGHICKKI